jgi:hypothetical protein
VARRRISPEQGREAIANLEQELATAVRYLLQEIELAHPGQSLEIRVPPFGAIQCLAGQVHRRGTPPSVLELEPIEFVELCLGKRSFDEIAQKASGVIANQAERLFPLSGN